MSANPDERLTLENLHSIDTILQMHGKKRKLTWTMRFFYFLHILLPNDFMSVSTACFLIILSFLQLLGLIINSQLQIGNSANPNEFLSSLLKLTSILPIFEHLASTVLYLIAVYIVIFLVFLLFVMGLWSYSFPQGATAAFLSSLIPVLFWVGVTIPLSYSFRLINAFCLFSWSGSPVSLQGSLIRQLLLRVLWMSWG